MRFDRLTWQASGTWFILVFMLGMGLSVLAALWSAQSISDRATAEFERMSNRTVLEVAARFNKPVYGLNGLRGEFALQSQVSRADFRTQVATRDLPMEFPGVRGFGFIQQVKRADLDTFLAMERADGAPQFAVHQLANTTQDDLFIIKFIEPLLPNKAAQGLDIGSEPLRRAGAQQAVDTGLPTITGGITLVQANKKMLGVLLYVPIYKQGLRPQGVAARHATLVGLLYAPIVMQELLANMPDVASGLLDFEVYDSAADAPNGTLMFDADNHVEKQTAAGLPPEANRRFSIRHALNLPGRQYTLSMHSTAQFDGLIDRTTPWLVLAGGVLTTLLLSLLMRMQAGNQAKAEALAQTMTADLDRMAQVVKHSSNAVMLSDGNGTITWVNEGFTRLTGYRMDEAIGKTPGELLGSDNGDPVTIQKLLAAQATGTACRVEILNRAKDGHEYWVDTEIQPQFDADRKIIGFMEIGTNITALRQTQTRMELALRDSDALLGTLNLHAIVSVANRAGFITEVNDAFCNISGYPREMLIGSTHRIVNSGFHPPEFFIDMWEDIASGRPWRGQVCNRARDGSLYWVDTFIASYMGDDGMADKYISIRTDITDSKVAELELRRVEATLRENVTLLDSVLENLPCGLSVFDSTLNLRASNSEFRRLLDLPDTVGGEPLNRFEDIIRFNAERGEYDSASTVDLAATVNTIIERARAPAVKHQFERVRPNDTALEIRGGPMPGGGFITTYTDITQRHRVQIENERITEALVHATHEAQEASKSKSQFLANMSHEIRTPMNAILGMLALLLKTSLTTRQADYASKAEGAARSLLGLLNEILDFSKIEANKMTLDPQPFRIDKLLRDLSVIVSASTGSRHLDVLFDIDPALPHQLVGDAMRLQQVLLNLTGNAIKFTHTGEVVVSIQVRRQDAQTVTLEFAVRDTGIGIAPENQARIFTGFTQAEASTTRKFGGTGLGVVISQRLVSLMGGELKLESALGQGSRFHFEITLSYQADADTALAVPLFISPLTSPLLHLPQPTQPREPQRVLMVDDNAAALDILARMGQSLGWAIDTATSGQQALKLLQAHSEKNADKTAGQDTKNTEHNGYQAIFMDWQMPDMDGWQTSQAIRALGPVGTQPVLVMVTANGREMLSERTDAEQALLDGFLVKPVTASMLFDAVVDARKHHLQSHPSRPMSASPHERLRGLRLLVVEDNLNNQQVARELLQMEGAAVHIANHGQEAIDAIDATTNANNTPGFDAVLMDLQMPVMDGFTATHHIRLVMGLTDLPIIAMTANAMNSDREACLAAGMNGHVGKPFDLDHLVQVLQQLASPSWVRAVAQGEQIDTASPVGAGPNSDQAEPAQTSLPHFTVALAAGVNLPAALNRLGHNMPLYERTLRQFVADLATLPAQLLAYQLAGDVPQATRALHTLKGLAATLGADALAAVASQGEKQLKSSAASADLPAVVARTCTAIEQASAPLKTLLNTLVTTLAASPPAAALLNAIPPGDSPPLDAAALALAVERLADKLRNFDMDAVQQLNHIQQHFGPALRAQNLTHLQSPSEPHLLDALQAAIDALNFEQALRLCDSLAIPT